MARFDCAIWRPVRNHGGAMSGQSGLVLHHAVAMGSLYARFNDPASEVSSTFWVALDGTIEQYVDSEIVAWANGTAWANANNCSVETEGCTTAPYAQPMSDAMVTALGTLYAEGNRRHGWPNALSNLAGAKGFGYHRLYVATACPCDVRLSRRQDILNLAFAAPTPTPAQGGDMIARNTAGNGLWAVRANADVYTLKGANGIEAPYIGPLPKYTQQWGIGTASNPVVGIVDDGLGGFFLETDQGAQPNTYHITADGQYAH